LFVWGIVTDSMLVRPLFSRFESLTNSLFLRMTSASSRKDSVFTLGCSFEEKYCNPSVYCSLSSSPKEIYFPLALEPGYKSSRGAGVASMPAEPLKIKADLESFSTRRSSDGGGVLYNQLIVFIRLKQLTALLDGGFCVRFCSTDQMSVHVSHQNPSPFNYEAGEKSTYTESSFTDVATGFSSQSVTQRNQCVGQRF
jgi:hypothetical protein